MVVKNNVTAMRTKTSSETTRLAQAKSMEKLSSGRKINRGADDAAGLAISEKMYRQMFALTQATSNAQDGISAVQTADGALNQVGDMLNRMSELSVKAGNETLAQEDRDKLQSEMDALRTEIDRVSETTTFNDQKLLDGSFEDGKRLQVGAEATDGNQIDIKIGKMDWNSISGNGTLNVANSDKIAETMSYIKTAQQNVSTMRSDMGATQNRLEDTVSNLRNVTENTTAAASSIRDTDYADEMVKLSNRKILAQAQFAMQAQANQANGYVLALLQ
ncbi:MAG: flagellin [Lachnospiraceae bacterium]|jgi:flagellin|nr:flagellin [Lachnospiraceae bacterium]